MRPVNTKRLVAADKTPEDWLSYGKNYNEDRFSPLKQINKSNIDSLGLAWSINLGTKRGIEATPLVVGGMMHVTGPWSGVYAIDFIIQRTFLFVGVFGTTNIMSKVLETVLKCCQKLQIDEEIS